MKKIALMLALFSGISLLSSCDKTHCGPRSGDKNCICTEEYAPVCGSNNKTYDNSCDAECEGITNYTQGQCATIQ